MKSFLFVILLSLTALLPFTCQADLIGVVIVEPVIMYDSTGDLTYKYNYDVGTGALTVNATPTHIMIDGALKPFLPIGPPTLAIGIVLNQAGAVVGGVGGPDIVVTGDIDLNGDGVADYQGLLLTGEIESFGFLDSGTTDRFDFCFKTTGGTLADPYGLRIGVTLTAEHSNFAGSFDVNFGGGAKGNIGKAKESVDILKTGAKVSANTRTIGFWKNNINKNIHDKRGTQVTEEQLILWLAGVQGFYLPDPFHLGITDDEMLAAAYDILSYSGKDIAYKTRRQLLACELNLLSGTYAMADVPLHESLCRAAEDALNTPGADLASLHTLLDSVNNLGDSCDGADIAAGDMIAFQITIVSTLAAPRYVDVRDCLDSSLAVLFSDNDGHLVESGNFVQWFVELPQGSSVTELSLWVKMTRLPSNDSSCPAGDWIASYCMELPLKTADIPPKCDAQKCAGPKCDGPKCAGPKCDGPKCDGPKCACPKCDCPARVAPKCPPPPPPVGSLRNCVCVREATPPEPGPCGPCSGKVTSLTLQYNGASGFVQVVQKKDCKEVFSGVVEPGQEFSFTGADKHGTLGTNILVYVGCSFNASIHTSCSQPIGPGLIRGDFTVISGTSKDGGPLCPLP